MKHFTMTELSRSATAERQGITNWPNPVQRRNLEALVDNVLDPLREAYGKPIHVNSGYRSPALNRAVKGAPASDHIFGKAADIVGTPNTKAENRKLFELVQDLGLSYKQLIDEKNYSWVHVSYDPQNVKLQVLHLK